jgi:hypothetical protein
MKTIGLKHSRSQGNALMVTIFLITFVGILLTAYLQMVKSQNYNTTRSQAWNSAIPVIEAGIEDALTHLNVHADNINCDGWTYSGGVWWVQRNVPEGYYVVSISGWIPNVVLNQPIVESRGFVTMPYLVADASMAAGPFLAATTGFTQPQSRYLGRGVRVRARTARIFTKGLVANGQIDMNGNNITADSYNSTNSLYSTNGKYDPAKKLDGGDVATNSGLTNSLSIGNADIMGRISTGPGGSISIGAQGQVGSRQWFLDNKRGVEPGWSTDDMNVDFPDVQATPSGGVPPGSGLVGGTNYTYLLGGATYQMDSLKLSGDSRMLITGNAVLYVTGDLDITGNGGIVIAPGASLKLYVGGANTSISGNGVVNESQSTLAFQYWGLPSNTHIDIGGNGGFAGLIYAPSADLTLHGGGTGVNGGSDKTVTDFFGATITKTAKLDGHFAFHYDEALKWIGPFRGYVASSWDEMYPEEVARMPWGYAGSGGTGGGIFY